MDIFDVVPPPRVPTLIGEGSQLRRSDRKWTKMKPLEVERDKRAVHWMYGLVVDHGSEKNCNYARKWTDRMTGAKMCVESGENPDLRPPEKCSGEGFVRWKNWKLVTLEIMRKDVSTEREFQTEAMRIYITTALTALRQLKCISS